MRNFVFELVGFTYNGGVKKTATRMAGFMEHGKDKVEIFSSLERALDNLLLKTGNVFCHNLEDYASSFLKSVLKERGYKFYETFQVDTNKVDKFVCVSKKGYGDFTIYTRNPKAIDGYNMLNFKDSRIYLPDKLSDLALSLNLSYKEFSSVPYGWQRVLKGNYLNVRNIFFFADKEKARDMAGKTFHYKTNKGKARHIFENERSIMAGHLKVLDKAMQSHNFYLAFENRIYSLSNMAMQSMLAGVEELDFKPISQSDFEPKNKFKGFEKKYKEKRYKRITPESSRTKKPKDIILKAEPRTEAMLDELEEMIDLMEEMLAEGDYTNYKSKMYLVKKLDQAKRYYMEQKSQMLRSIRNESAKISYRSGFNYINPYYINDWIEGIGITIDENSKYSHEYSTQKLPKDYVDHVRNLKEFERKYGDGNHLYIAQIIDLEATCKEDCVPILKPKLGPTMDSRAGLYDLASIGSLEDYIRGGSYNYQIELHSTFLAQPDFEYLLENYKIQYLHYTLMVLDVDYELMAKLKKHGEVWGAKKEAARRAKDPIAYTYCKAILNRVVGYLGVNKSSISSTQSYVAVASFINSYARKSTGELINKIGLENFCYSAVDSIHFKLPKEVLVGGEYDKEQTVAYLESLGIEVDPVKIGAWKIENVWKKAKYMNVSCYGELSIFDEWETTVSGFTQQIPIEKFEDGELLQQSLYLSEGVEGGVLKLPTYYALNKMDIFD